MSIIELKLKTLVFTDVTSIENLNKHSESLLEGKLYLLGFSLSKKVIMVKTSFLINSARTISCLKQWSRRMNDRTPKQV